MPDAASAPVVHQRVVRLARQLKLLHSAIARWATPDALTPFR
jgi:hypothetical protein